MKIVALPKIFTGGIPLVATTEMVEEEKTKSVMQRGT